VESNTHKASQQLMPGFEPSEKDLIDRALAQPLEDKIRRSIEMFRLYEAGALRMSPDGYYLAFSGGKDSCVIKQLAIEAGVKFRPVYNNTTIDPPELIRYIRKHHADVAWNNHRTPMLRRLVENPNGPPTRLARWCCEVYKEQGGKGCLRVIGVRIAESERRARLWKEFQPHRTDGAILAPIVYWTDEDVWAFIRSRNLPYCELYDQGFKRLGCVGCPMAGPAGQRKEFARWPGYERAWKKAIFLFFATWKGVPLERPYWEKLAPRKRYSPLATQFGIGTVDTAEEAQLLRCPIGTQVRTQLHWWRWFEPMKSPQELWDWWRSGKASEGEAQCFQEEMDMNV